MGIIESDYTPPWHAHLDHPWMQIRNCVYCGLCVDERQRPMRLYQGQIPKGHPVMEPEKTYSQTKADEMRARWGMMDRGR